MNTILELLAAHGVAFAVGVLIGAAITIAFLASLLAKQQYRRDEAYLDGYEAGVRDTKAEANIAAFGRLGKRANL